MIIVDFGQSEVEQEGNLWMKSRNKGNLSATSSNGQKGNFARSRSSLTRSSQRKPIDPLDASPTSLVLAQWTSF